jgi:hypothetical protein
MATAIYSNLIGQILAIIQGVASIKKIYSYPESKITQYPAVIFLPVDFENSFETTKENKKIYRFKMWVLLQANQSNLETIFGTELPKRVDEILEAFDAGWSMTAIAGHRAWMKIDSGEWGNDTDGKGFIVYAQFNIDIQLLTSN